MTEEYDDQGCPVVDLCGAMELQKLNYEHLHLT